MMKRYLLLIVLAALYSVAFSQADNLLTNPGFEAPFTNQGGDPPRQVANGWVAWHVQRSADEPDFQNTQPEYGETIRDDRIRSGDNAQRFESFFATHTGGVFQVVSGVREGQELTFGAYVWVWSSALDDEDVSEDDGDVIIDVGIDPNGGTDGTSPDIVWSVGQEQYDEYNLYTVSAIAEGDSVSVWVRSRVGFAVKTSRIYVDDAFLTVEGEVATEEPTPEETEEPTPEETEEPTPVETEEPTAIPATPTQEIVDTAVPTSTTPPISSEFPDTITHTVQRGDTVSRLATRYDSSIQAIQQANGLNDTSLIFVGQSLVIPVRAGFQPTEEAPTATATSVVIVITATPGPAATSTPVLSGDRYIVQPGDTLSSIARRFNTTVAALAQLNGIVNANRIFTGQQLIVPVSSVPTATPIPVTATPVVTATPIPPTGPQTYIVQPGDNLFRISLRFGVPVSDLIRANGIVNANRIFTGQQLIIP